MIKKAFARLRIFISTPVFYHFLLFSFVLFGILYLLSRIAFIGYFVFFSVILFMVLSDHKKNLPLLMLVSAASVFMGSPLNVGGPTTYCVIAYLLIAVFDSFRLKKAINSKTLVSALLLVVFIALTFTVSCLNKSKVSLYSAISFYFYMLFALIASVCVDNEKNVFLSCVEHFEIGQLIVTLFAFVSLLMPVTREIVFSDSPELTFTFSSLFGSFRFRGLAIDQNEFAMLCFIPVCFFVASRSWVTIEKKRLVFDWFLALFLLAFACLSKSKSFFICLIIFFIFYLLKFAFKNPIWFLVFFAGGLLLLGMVFFIGGSRLFLSVFDRFFNVYNKTGELMDYITTARWGKWITYSEYLFSNPWHLIFGQGAKSMYTNRLIGVDVAHDFLINLVWDFGLVGTLLFALYFVVQSEFKVFTSDGYQNFLCLLPLLTFFLFAFGLTLTGSYEIFYFFLFFNLLCRERKAILHNFSDENPNKLSNRVIDFYGMSI